MPPNDFSIFVSCKIACEDEFVLISAPTVPESQQKIQHVLSDQLTVIQFYLFFKMPAGQHRLPGRHFQSGA